MTREVPDELNEFLTAFPPEVISSYLATRAEVLKLAPQANELIYDAYNALSIAYSFTENLKQGFIHIAAYAKHVNLGFNQGATLPDPGNLLQGNGTRIRHIKIRNQQTLQNPAAISLIKLAILQGEALAAEVSSARPVKGRSFVKSISPNKRRPN